MTKHLMTRQWLVVLATVVVAVTAVAGGWKWYTEQQAAEAGMLRASGRLESTEINLSSEVGGVLATRPVQEGDRVQRGAVLAAFDTDLLYHQIATADTVTRLHLQLQRDRQTLRAPFEGWVIRTDFEPGEMVPPGAPVVVLTDWRQLTLKVYLPEDQFGRVAIHQSAQVSVDSYPGEVFTGSVTSIASDAEFTPRDMQTQEDRVKSVYAIKLRVPNADLRLKPGMFADAVFTISPGRTGS